MSVQNCWQKLEIYANALGLKSAVMLKVELFIDLCFSELNLMILLAMKLNSMLNKSRRIYNNAISVI